MILYEKKNYMLIYVYDGCELYLENIIIHDLVMLHVT